MKKTLLTCFSILCLIFTSSSQTTFSSKMTINADTGEDPFAITSGDLDNDGDNDILIGTSNLNASITVFDTLEWYKNDGTGTFIQQIDVSANLKQISGLQIVDLNGDGFNDIVATSSFHGKLVWYENDQMGGFGAENIISSTISGANATFAGLIDSDATIDIAVSASSVNKVVWYSNDGSGNFSTENTITTALTAPGDIDMVDFDSDGDLDIVIVTNDGDLAVDLEVIEIFYNNLDPPTNNPVTFTIDANSVSSTTSNTYLWDVSFADVNDDNVLDILVSDLYGDVAWYTKEMDGTFTETIIPITFNHVDPNRPAATRAIDLNNDGFTDIVISNGATNGDDIIWLESTGAGTYFPETAIDATQAQVYGMAFDDFDGDGNLDVASMAFQENDLNWFSNNFVLGLDDNTLNKISIYPNPTSSKLFFKGNFDDNLKVSVFDILGKSIIETTINSNKSLDVSQLNTGIYIIKFDDYNSTYKFVKE